MNRLNYILLFIICSLCCAQNRLLSTQNAISESYRNITEIDQAIIIEEKKLKLISEKHEVAENQLITINKQINLLTTQLESIDNEVATAMNKLYKLSFLQSNPGKVYTTYYVKKIHKHQEDLSSLRGEKLAAHNLQENNRKKSIALLEEKQSLIHDMETKRYDLKKRIVELQTAMTRLVAASKNKELAFPHEERELISIETKKGQLSWPVNGEVIQKYGQKILESNHTNDAITIKTKQSSKIRAVWPGVIVHDQWVPSYGYLVIIDHGFGYHSLYGHLQKVLAHKGQYVKETEFIGESSSGTDFANELYFSLKHNLAAKDPLLWLKH